MELRCSNWEVEASVEMPAAGPKSELNAIPNVEVVLAFISAGSLIILPVTEY
jgi:hypothetical protein